MAEEKTPWNEDEPPINPKTHRRLLRFINAAQTSEDLLVAPNDRKVADEKLEHEHGAEQHHHEEKQLLQRADAGALVEARDRVSPLNGFAHLREVVAINPRFAELLPNLLQCFGPAKFGRWDLLYPLNPGGTPMAIEHAALMRNYKVIFLADGTDTGIWDPSDEVNPIMSRLTAADTGLAANIVCCGHSFLSDGQLLAVGGGGLGPGNPTSIQGWKFDPLAEKWNRTAGDMSSQRWYPTNVTLGDEAGPNTGRVLIAAGAFGGPVMEVYSEASDSFSTMTVNGAINHSFSQLYPSLHLLPGGEIFYVPTGFGNCSTGGVAPLNDPSGYFTFTGALDGEWEDTGGPTNRTKGMSALILDSTYPFVRVIAVGGGDASTSSTIEIANLSTLSPSWDVQSSIPDGRARVNVNVVLLPDGTVFISGGLQGPPQTSYIYDPSSASPWSEMDELNRPRHYHSCALLLPSGKVMAAGGAAAGGCTVSVENTIEVFSPPYLFNSDGSPADRPTIASVNGVEPTAANAPVINHGESFDIETPDAGCVAKVVLVRPMACTHNTDTEQRVIQCDFVRTEPYMIRADAPNGKPPAIAPRGFYMLFILSDEGVPSEGKFVHLL
ncbi:MAG TPA: galactose oxidase-like domain-containing protein [Pyrinomonadaceae bacterium]|nr:galactose oxidase-like domain-containing protein [Pyrinomonadaceae bacterium]